MKNISKRIHKTKKKIKNFFLKIKQRNTSQCLRNQSCITEIKLYKIIITKDENGTEILSNLANPCVLSEL